LNGMAQRLPRPCSAIHVCRLNSSARIFRNAAAQTCMAAAPFLQRQSKTYASVLCNRIFTRTFLGLFSWCWWHAHHQDQRHKISGAQTYRAQHAHQAGRRVSDKIMETPAMRSPGAWRSEASPRTALPRVLRPTALGLVRRPVCPLASRAAVASCAAAPAHLELAALLPAEVAAALPGRRASLLAAARLLLARHLRCRR
jgi:hypothetical protein